MSVPRSTEPLHLMTVAEVSQLLRVHPKTVYAWVAAGTFPGFKINGALRFNRESIDSYLQACALKPPVETSQSARQPTRSDVHVQTIVARAKGLLHP